MHAHTHPEKLGGVWGGGFSSFMQRALAKFSPLCCCCGIYFDLRFLYFGNFPVTFLQSLNLLLGKRCSVSLQLPLQLESHLSLIRVFSVGTDGVGVLSPSFLLLAAICNKKNRTIRGMTQGLLVGLSTVINSKDWVVCVSTMPS